MHINNLKGNETDNNAHQAGQDPVQKKQSVQTKLQKTSADGKPSIQAKQRPIQAKHKPIQAKHKPIQAKHKPIQAKHKPVQRNKKKSTQLNSLSGQEKSTEIAKSLGEKHNVDTSNLQFNHNSAFPKSVNAEATIQGNKIDFAPGKDTTDNIKHEVGHHIVNTKRGTPPKADSVVNGQAVNTTDEVAADKIMNESLPTQQGEGGSVQMKASGNSGNTAPLQRVQVQDSGDGTMYDTEEMITNPQQGMQFVAELAMRFLIMHNMAELRKIQEAHQNDFKNQGIDISTPALWRMSGLGKKGKAKKQVNDNPMAKDNQDMVDKYQMPKSYDPSISQGYKPTSGKDVQKSRLKPGGDMDDHRMKFGFVLDQVQQDYDNGKIPEYTKAEQKRNPRMRYQNVPEAYQKEMDRLTHIQKIAQEFFGSDGIRIIARFYVEDAKNGTEFPGLNSWHSLKGDKNCVMDPDEARNHMINGHDVGNSDDNMTHSPFVSGTGDMAKLLLADSPFNPYGKENKLLAAANKGHFYSERIDRLLYGHGNAKDNKEKMGQAPVANKIAFLAVIEDAYTDAKRGVYTPEKVQAAWNACCTLEDEHVLFAPHEHLQDITLGIQDNLLPGIHNVEKAKEDEKEKNDPFSHLKRNSSNNVLNRVGSLGRISSTGNLSNQGSFYDDDSQHDAIKSSDSMSTLAQPKETISDKRQKLLNKFEDYSDIKEGVEIISGGKIWVVTSVDSKEFQAYDKSEEIRKDKTFKLRYKNRTKKKDGWTLNK